MRWGSYQVFALFMAGLVAVVGANVLLGTLAGHTAIETCGEGRVGAVSYGLAGTRVTCKSDTA